MKTEKFVYRYRGPDGVLEPARDSSIALIALNAFVTSLKLAGHTREADPALWTGKVLKQERVDRIWHDATIIFTKK